MAKKEIELQNGKKKIPGYYWRPDGLLEKKIMRDGKSLTFRGKNKKEVDTKIINHKKELENKSLFSILANSWKEEHWPTLTENTKRGYRAAYKRIVSHFGETPVNEVTALDIRAYIKKFSKDRGYKTVANELSIITMILDYAGECSELEYNPARFVKIPRGLERKPREFPSDEDLKLVKENYNIEPPYGLLMYVALYTGFRRGELFALQWKDIDFKESTISVKKSMHWANNQAEIKSTKTKAGERTIFLLDKLREVLEPIQSKPDEFIFTVNRTVPSRTMIERGLLRYRDKTGVKIMPHALRHAFTTMCVEHGVRPEIIQYMVGHANLSTTMDTYNEIRLNRAIDAGRQLNNIDIVTQ